MTVQIYNDDPSSTKAILSVSNELANNGLHDAALLFAEKGLELPLDHETKTALLERTSISGFYSKIDSRKQSGKDACETIATDRQLSWFTKNLARQNSTYYAKSASDLMPATRLNHLEFVPNDNYKPMNPSIANNGDELWMIQRTVNYIIRPDGSYDMGDDSAIRTRNYLLRLADDLTVTNAEEIFPPIDLPEPLYNLVIGWEDCRLFFWNGEPYCTATVRELNADGYCEIVLSAIIRHDDGLLRFSDYKVIRPQFCDKQHEKNWMPMVSGQNVYFVYSSDPTRIIDVDGRLISTKATHIAADSFRGGSPLLEFEDGWLAIIHESHVMPDNRRRYMHRFVWYDPTGRLIKYSEAFYINSLGIEFAAGLARNFSTNEIVVSFGFRDKESWLAVFSADEIKKILKPAGLPAMYLPTDTYTISWLIRQTNTALLNNQIFEKCKSIVSNSLLSLHHDGPKNWDNLIAIWHATSTTDLASPVMDIAATKESAFLPSLKKLGYLDLVSINIDQPVEEVIDGIKYLRGDCTKTAFPDNHFGFISCLSVIEHGVDVDKFMSESARILSPGGHLLVSTDYWKDPVDTMGQTAFGAPVKVFTANDISDLILTAKKYGLEVTSNVDLSCDQRVVNWIGMDYTFINILFYKSIR